MRAIDADALQLAIVEEGQANKRKKYIIGDIWELTGAEIREVINSQPTIQPVITHEQAVAYLQSTGWMQEHDRQMMLDRNKLLAEYDRQHMGEAGNARKIMEQAETVIEGSEA